jgi:sulfotransferase family protein
MQPGPAEPFFVGGTGRSGTTIVGELLGARADMSLVPIELRFHVDRGGLADLGRGEIEVEDFVKKMRNRWYQRKDRNGPRGLHVIATRPQMRAGFRALREGYDADPWAACGAFMDAVIRPYSEEHGTPTWVEMTPPNARGVAALHRMFPRARVVHMVRDGRDVASSVARRFWGPNDIESALVWWADQLIAIHEAEREADPERLLRLRLEALVGPDREDHYQHLVEFVGRGDDAGMRRFFDTEMTAEKSHPGSWRRSLDDETQHRVDALYDEQLARLSAHGVDIPPA